jgi:hypothetical protein
MLRTPKNNMERKVIFMKVIKIEKINHYIDLGYQFKKINLS